jgi:hypothetical protein
MVEWLILQLRILEVPGSNFGPENYYMTVIVVYLSPSVKFLDLKLGHGRSFTSFPIHRLPITLLFDAV